MNATIRNFMGLFKDFALQYLLTSGGWWVFLLVKQRGFSLYDIEQFIREAGAEKINEKAVVSLEKELEDTVNELVNEASMYANYAGRKRLINISDIELANSKGKRAKLYIMRSKRVKRRQVSRKVVAVSRKQVLKQ